MIGKPGTKLKYGKCDACGKPSPLGNLYPLDGEALCIDCYSANAPMPGEGGDGGGTSEQLPPLTPPSDRILEVLRLYADADNWGDSNQTSRSTHWKGTQGAGFGPARRLLKEIEG